jgi:hypothetical protein
MVLASAGPSVMPEGNAMCQAARRRYRMMILDGLPSGPGGAA